MGAQSMGLEFSPMSETLSPACILNPTSLSVPFLNIWACFNVVGSTWSSDIEKKCNVHSKDSYGHIDKK
jgi:hypothetical protein